uniref:Uncharacterized protein n=1 Tax=Rhizophora mucronata TaxID=61149 RepID=A0A2P2PBJ0_RHIMU
MGMKFSYLSAFLQKTTQNGKFYRNRDEGLM